MNDKYVILLDAGFLIKALQKENGRFPTATDVEQYCQTLIEHDELKSHSLLRINFYHAKPYDKEMTNPVDGSKVDFSKTEPFQNQTNLLNGLAKKNYFALRLGEVSASGWELKPQRKRKIQKKPNEDYTFSSDDFCPKFQQKGVDLRIGLDIARFALEKTVSKLVVCTGDSDLTPAFKFARREGLQVFLSAMGKNTKDNLKLHSDVIIN